MPIRLAYIASSHFHPLSFGCHNDGKAASMAEHGLQVADLVGRSVEHKHDNGGERLRERVQQVDHVLEAFATGSTDRDDVGEVTVCHCGTLSCDRLDSRASSSPHPVRFFRGETSHWRSASSDANRGDHHNRVA